MKVTNFSKSTKLPALPKDIDGHALEAFKSQHGIVLFAPTHPKQPTFLLLRGEAPSQVGGSLKQLLLDLAKGRGAAEAALSLKHAEFAKTFYGIEG